MAQQLPPVGVRLPSHLQPRSKATATASSSEPSFEGLKGDDPGRSGGRPRSPDASHRKPLAQVPLSRGGPASVDLHSPGAADLRMSGTHSSGDGLVNTIPTDVPRVSSRSRLSSHHQGSGTTASAPSVRTSNAQVDVTDQALETLIRRVLCPYSHNSLEGPRALDQLLPPLTSSNAVDLQLYAVLAIVVKEFVASWYAKITPDQTFVEEVVRIVAHCSRELEQRLRRLDLGSLFLDEIPALVQNHVSGEFQYLP